MVKSDHSIKGIYYRTFGRAAAYRLHSKARGRHPKSKAKKRELELDLGRARKQRGEITMIAACVLAVLCLLALHWLDESTFADDIQYIQTLI